MKRLITLLLTMLMLLNLALSVSAQDVPSVDRLCTIELIVSYDGKAVSGGTLTVTRIADIGESDGNYYFRSLMDGTVLLSSKVQSSKTALEMAEKVDGYHLDTWEKTIPANGIVKLENMKTGLYLIRQKEASPGYYAMAPFLVSLPYMEDGTYRYDITAKVKSEPEPITPPTSSEPTCPTSPTCPSNPPKPGKPVKPSRLPQTGQLTWPVPVMTISGMILLITGWWLCFGRRKDTNEN